jgi:formylglycine-generating enzyme required for sulfatase activity
MRVAPNASAVLWYRWLAAIAMVPLALLPEGTSGRTANTPALRGGVPQRAVVVPRDSTAARGEFDDCGGAAWCPRMVAIPAGTFMMGSPKAEPGRFDDEAQRRVRVGALAVAKYPVTRGQWAAFVAATRRPTPDAPCAYARTGHPTWKDTGFPQDDQHPVVCVTWADAQHYARWLSARTGKHYRLLTDPEWEYAARGRTTTAYPWGSAASHEFGNYGQDKCCGPMVRGRDRWQFTSPVRSFPPNAFGLYDMHGNVTVWLETCADSAEKLPIPKGARGCTYRYGRGANYDDYPAMMRSAAKNLAPPPGGPLTIETYRSTGFGIRVARDLAPAPSAH